MRARAPGPPRHHAQRAAREEWFLAEWPADESEPTKYWLSTLPAERPIVDLVATAKLRWRIERDYQELKQETGLGDYEGRGWRGFHHHATLCIATYGFLISERNAIPPFASSLAETGWCVASRGSRVIGRPRPLQGLIGSGASPGYHRLVVD